MQTSMWKQLSSIQKEKYKAYITNFASLSELFSQKADSENADEIIAPIVNSKFQEVVFAKSFNAVNEDIANTSYDASVVCEDGAKYLVGIKSFGLSSGSQKIAQFKKNSNSEIWSDLIHQIRENAKIANNKDELDKLNQALYYQLACEIARLRNQRIASSKAQIKGFQGDSEDVQSVYHVLMPSPKNTEPKIHVGETTYTEIDIDNIEIIGSTGPKTPLNFDFTDNQHTYRYTNSDSQLLMAFNNANIIQETWDINYIDDPFVIFEKLGQEVKPNIIDSVCWKINIEDSSGFNAFDGVGKNLKQNTIEKIEKIKQKYANEPYLDELVDLLNQFLFGVWDSKAKKQERKNIRNKLMDLVTNEKLLKELKSWLYRSANEVYIPIVNSPEFHRKRPNFFGVNIGTFISDTNKLALPKENRVFNLEFLKSGNRIKAYINQDNGKAIQSYENQDILGKWLLEQVFQLKPREPLTEQRLNELEINAIRLIKFDDHIGLDFIWVDDENKPDDYFE